ncbi:MAG: hypothetical protein PHP70_04380 [Gallionella sp.]|nr:hypothetical protein [Gallionella sp.]
MTETTSLERRELLKKIAAAGLLHSCGMLGLVQQALAANSFDLKQGMISVTGGVSVNGHRAYKGNTVKPGQTVTTAKGAEAIYVIGSNAFLQRESSTVSFGTETFTDFMRVVSGHILSVFGTGDKSLKTAHATIGIRGTACHIVAESDRTYLCLCYGEAEITLPTQLKDPIRMKSAHHDQPVYITSGGTGSIQPAMMQDHHDDELKLLEALAGRLPPFIK